MERYARRDYEAYLLAQWWAEITVDGSRDLLFMPPNALGSTMAYFESPDVTLIYEVDERGLWFAMWFAPIFTGLSASMWCRRDRRGRREHLAAAEWGYDTALTVVPTLVGVTTQQRLLKAHERLGYTVVGVIPNLVNGQDAWIVALTREGWQARKARQVRRKVVSVG